MGVTSLRSDRFTLVPVAQEWPERLLRQPPALPTFSFAFAEVVGWRLLEYGLAD